jgi:hypothetical protein
LTAHDLKADGAVFLSRRLWYGLRFTCALTPDLARVVAFAYRIGDPVPKREWASLNLPTGAEPSD